MNTLNSRQMHRIGWLVAAFLMASACGQLSRALEIDVRYRGVLSNPPADDLTGEMLTDVVEAAASHWMDLIEDDHTMVINLWYAPDSDFSGTTTIAYAELVTPDAADTRTLEGNIVFRNSLDYYYDDSPDNHSEFNMNQWLFSDLGTAIQLEQYNVTSGTPLLEEGYYGVAYVGSPAEGLSDVYSTALHELGHHLGVTNQLAFAVGEWQSDGDYDLPSSLLGGFSMAARTVDSSGHLAPDTDEVTSVVTGNKLLQPGLPIGYRRLPSATDVLAAAAGSKWNEINLKRTDLMAGTTWNNPVKWEGRRLPDNTDDAYVRLGGTVQLDIDDAVENLYVGNFTTLRTGTNGIGVGDTTRIEYVGPFQFEQVARMLVESGGELETNHLIVNGGELELQGGLADVLDTLATFNTPSAGSISGFGNVRVGNYLENNGTIAADGGTLFIESFDPGAVFDLDGQNDNGFVLALTGNLVVSEHFGQNFLGTMRIGAGHEITIQDSWTLAAGGVLNLNGDGVNSAVLRGGELTVASTINVERVGVLGVPAVFTLLADVNIPDADDVLHIGLQPAQTISFNGGMYEGNGAMSFNGTIEIANGAGALFDVHVNVPGVVSVRGNAVFEKSLDLFSGSVISAIGTGDILMNGVTRFHGGSVTGDGTIYVNGTGRVVENQSVSMTGTFDLDGNNNVGQFFVEPGRTFNLLANTINVDVVVDDIYRGEMNLAGSSLLVDVASNLWTMGGTLNLTGSGGQGSTVGGDPVSITGTLNASGEVTHTFSVPTTFGSGSTTNLSNGATLLFQENVGWEGGSHTGDGKLLIDGLSTIVSTIGGNTVINVNEIEVGFLDRLRIDSGNVRVNDLTLGSGAQFEQNGGGVTIAGGDATIPNGGGFFSNSNVANEPVFSAVEGADVTIVGTTRLAEDEDTYATINVSGTNADGSRRSSLETGSLDVGYDGVGTLLVDDGGYVDHQGLTIADGATAQAGVIVNGVRNVDGNLIRSEIDGSSIQVSPGGGSGQLNIRNGGLVTAALSVGIASRGGSFGTINVGGAEEGLPAELNVANDIIMGRFGALAGGNGRLNIDDGGRVTATEIQVWQNSTVDLDGGELMVDTLNIEPVGTVGTFDMAGGVLSVIHVIGDLAPTGGVIAPGESPGTTHITGDYSQGKNVTLAIEIAGTSPGTEFDQVTVDGMADLAGILDVSLLDGFRPLAGQQFEVLTAANVVDNGITLGGEVADLFALTINPTNVVLESLIEILAGDYNDDGIVNAADFVVWRNHEGQAFALPNEAPTVTPGMVTPEDYEVWVNNFGNGLGSGSADGADVVPEPATTMIAVCSMLVFGMARRKIR